MGCLRLSMWSGPRNVSTALMYAFRQRSDTRVLDEPLYGHYLKVSGAAHPGALEVMKAMDCDGERVIRDILLGPCDKSVLFFKNMAHHLTGLKRDFLRDLTNLLLTRDPREMLPSLARQIPEPSLRDTGLREQVEILELELEAEREPVVLEAKELLLDPAGVLRQACAKLAIPFEPAMLSWEAGPKPEDGVWAKHWYASVHKSTGFGTYQAKREPFPKELVPLLELCLPLYEKLKVHALRAGA
jgi:hypothetical protein